MSNILEQKAHPDDPRISKVIERLVVSTTSQDDPRSEALRTIEYLLTRIAVLEADKEKLQADLDAHLEFIKSETPGAPKA